MTLTDITKWTFLQHTQRETSKAPANRDSIAMGCSKACRKIFRTWFPVTRLQTDYRLKPQRLSFLTAHMQRDLGIHAHINQHSTKVNLEKVSETAFWR